MVGFFGVPLAGTMISSTDGRLSSESERESAHLLLKTHRSYWNQVPSLQRLKRLRKKRIYSDFEDYLYLNVHFIVLGPMSRDAQMSEETAIIKW
jgi:hypothetical protein